MLLGLWTLSSKRVTSRPVLTAAIASAIVVMMTAGAFARTFEAVYSVKIHSTANKKSAPVDTLYEGERVTVTRCDDNQWCLIRHSGPDGWVPMAALAPVAGSDVQTIITFDGGGFLHPKPPKPKHLTGHLIEPGFPAGGGPRPVRPPPKPKHAIGLHRP